MELRDYSIEFTGRVEQGGLCWVVRFKDPDNYCAMKLERKGQKLELVRWVVASGREGDAVRAAVGLEPETFRVRVDVRGPKCATFLRSRQIDSFIDNRLVSGGFGFYNEEGGRARVESLRVLVNGA